MTEQASKAEILYSIARERERLMTAVRALDDRATTAAVTAEGWTAWVEAVGGKRLEGDDVWNRVVVEHHCDVPLTDVIREFDRVVDLLVHQLRTRDDIDVNASAKAAISWAPADKALWRVIAGETYAHWHTADIERAAQVTA